MKTFILIIAVLVALIALKVIALIHDSKPIKSVGGKSNNNSKNIARYDISDPEDMKRLVEDFKGMAD